MLNKELIQKAFGELDKIVDEKINILIGGGAALLLLDIMPISTFDVDAIPFKSIIGPEELKTYREIVAKKLKLPADWINEYFYQFAHCLPSDYGNRLIITFRGKKVTCHVLHPTDIAIMKLFAHRQKDEIHLRHLLKNKKTDVDFIDNYLNEMVDKNHPGAKEACDYFNNISEVLGLV